MKRIEFIAPVEAMRGNLSGNQNLLYAENDNKAFEAPNGKQYARNYQPRFIGAKRASDNLKYFTVRTKNAVQLDSFTRGNMALLGASGALFAYYTKPAQAVQIAILGMILAAKQNAGIIDASVTLRQFVMGEIRAMLQDKAATRVVSQGVNTVTIGNPWIDNTYIQHVGVTTLQKFWKELSTGVTYSVDGVNGVNFAYAEQDFADCLGYPELNPMGLILDEDAGGDSYVMTADHKYVTLQRDPEHPTVISYIEGPTLPIDAYKYETTEVAPA